MAASSVFVLGYERIAATFVEDSSHVLRYRIADRSTVYNAEGTPLLQANLSAIAITVTDITTGTATLATTTLTVSSVIFDTLQGWEVDNVGYNFRYTVAASAFPTGGSTYAIDVKWTHTDARVGHTVWEGMAQKLYVS